MCIRDRGLGVRSMLMEWGISMGPVKAHTDATAAKGIASRRGVGKVRHICVTDLWLQERTQCGDVEIIKVSTHQNVADAMTKYMISDILIKMLRSAGIQFKLGRHPDAPQV